MSMFTLASEKPAIDLEREIDAFTDIAVRDAIAARIGEIAIPPTAIARGIAYAIDQPDDVDVGRIVIRPTAQD